jgi:hypothetical protein
MPDPSALPPSLQRGADKLATRLAAANRRVYRQAIADHAAAFGAKAPRHIQSQAVKEAIAERARASAESITATEARARQRFYEATGSVAGAKEQYRAWTDERAPMIARFEAGMAASAAARDFRERNADVLSGRAHVEPPDTDSSDVCADLIAAGDVDLSDMTDDLPAHPHCPHYWQVAYDPVDDPGALWVGGPDEEDDGA